MPDPRPVDVPAAGPAVLDESGFTHENALGGTAAPRYRQWEYDLVAPHLGLSVLEIGSGMGHFSSKLVESGHDRVVLSDTDAHCLTKLAETYAGNPRVEVVAVPLPGTVNIGGAVDSVVAINVLEHIEDDVRALRDLAEVVRPGGSIVLWVPAYMQLYGEFDRKVGHFRRYTPVTIRRSVEQAGLRVRVVRQVNFLGGIAWWLAVRHGRAGAPNRKLVWLYDNVVIPVSRAVEKVVRPPFGQSVICLAEVPAK